MNIKNKNKETNEVAITKIPIYKGDDKISGKIDIRSRKKFDHTGIKVELIGLIETTTDETQTSVFMSNGLDLEPPGTKNEDQTHSFNFSVFQKPYESYYGSKVKLRYCVRVTILQSKYKSSVIKEQDIGVVIPTSTDEKPVPINIEVGIDDFLSIRIDIPKNIYDLKETIEGKILFLFVKLVLTKMELSIIRKEKIGIGEKAITNTEEVFNFELMDGIPIKEEEIPIRLFLSAVPELTSTMTNINNKFSVQYLLSISLTGAQQGKYFKNSEIKFFKEDN